MPVRITNLSPGLLTLELNSGESLYLAPSETSRSLPDLEVTGNRWVQRLLDRDLIAVEQEAEPAAAAAAAKARPAARRKRSSKA
jgi:hypothetical protein